MYLLSIYIFLLRAHGPIIELARTALNARRSVHTHTHTYPFVNRPRTKRGSGGGGREERERKTEKRNEKREERKKCLTERKQFKGLCLCPSRREERGGYHRTHPLSPLEETDPSSGPSYSLERASYEIYKQASALQIIHHWTVRRACVCASKRLYNLSIHMHARMYVRRRKQSSSIRSVSFPCCSRTLDVYALTDVYTSWARKHVVMLGSRASHEHLIEIGRSTIIRSTAARPGCPPR